MSTWERARTKSTKNTWMSFNVPHNSVQCTLEWKTLKIQTWRADCDPWITHALSFVFYWKPLPSSFHISFCCIASILGVVALTHFRRSGQRASELGKLRTFLRSQWWWKWKWGSANWLRPCVADQLQGAFWPERWWRISESDIFQLFYNDKVFNLPVVETNRHATQVSETATPYSHVLQWIQMTLSEMKAFIALLCSSDWPKDHNMNCSGQPIVFLESLAPEKLCPEIVSFPFSGFFMCLTTRWNNAFIVF